MENLEYMMKIKRILLFTVLVILLAACRASESNGESADLTDPTTTDTLSPSAAEPGGEVDITLLVSISDTPQPSATSSPTFTLAPGETPIPSATPWIVYVTSEDVLALRTGPGVYYQILDLLPEGTAVYILGTEPARRWFLVHRVEEIEGVNEGWVFGDYLSIDRNNLGLIPVVDATPTPSLIQNTPDLTATQECKWLEDKGTPCP
jgi:uncharacterized protein YgiM (DUF1202 family)